MRSWVIGCGYVGRELATVLRQGGEEVVAVGRRPPALGDGIVTVRADLSDRRSLDALPRPVDRVFFTAAPDASDERSYRSVYVEGTGNLVATLACEPRPPRLVFTSSTSVYGQTGGEWVDERSATEPVGFRGRVMLEAEAVALDSGLRASCLRLGGIYGPGRDRLIRWVEEGRPIPPERSPRFTNRIHRDDAARALAHVADLDESPRLLLGVDDEPAALREVLVWLASRIGVEPREGGDAPLDGGKRCRNAALRSCGFEPGFPTFRAGYGALIEG